ncbi:ureidoglycolate lyase [Methylobacterium currus]|uniref:ureidoglycolate lyase n=1 Tax=Methylobacterium currus TaxID=2051553 RepID=UPI001E585283|nr:ureidoglycolate lyase [Methylobacterium currus]UHC15582.1 ureidoglycolate lyase [Methylobacterium currus]
MRTLPIEPITADAFAPFGTLLVGPAAGPRQDRAAEIENGRPAAALNLALIRSEPFADTMPLRRLERHPHSAQGFLPLAVGDYLVVVAPDECGRPDEAALRAFRVPGDTGIVYRSGAWHAHMTTLSGPGTFAMLVHEDGSAEDCVFAPIASVVPEA